MCSMCKKKISNKYIPKGLIRNLWRPRLLQGARSISKDETESPIVEPPNPRSWNAEVDTPSRLLFRRFLITRNAFWYSSERRRFLEWFDAIFPSCLSRGYCVNFTTQVALQPSGTNAPLGPRRPFYYPAMRKIPRPVGRTNQREREKKKNGKEKEYETNGST